MPPHPPGAGDAGAGWLLLLTVMLGSVAGIMSSTMIMVAVPAIGAHFHAGQASVQWGVTAYMLAMTLSMLLTPWLLRRFGLRRGYTGAVLTLLAGGLLSGSSVSFPMLLCMRVVEGAAAGVIQPIPVIVILSTFPAARQGRAIAWYGVGAVVFPAIGPWFGGLLVESFGWRSVLFVDAPLCLVVLALIRRHVPALPASPAGGQSAGAPDWRGLALIGAGVIALINGLARFCGDRAQGIVLVLSGLACCGAFAASQRGRAGALLDMRLFGYRQFTMGALVSFTYGMGVFGSTYLLPVYLQMGLHYTSARAGLVLLPAGVVLALSIMAAGRLIDHWRPHHMVAAGLSILAASFALMTAGAGAPSYALMMGLTMFGRVGLGLILPALSLGSMRGMPADLISQGATAINFVRQLGGAIGVSLVGIVLDWRLAAHAASHRAGGVAAFNETLLMVAAMSGAAVLAALAMRPREPAG